MNSSGKSSSVEVVYVGLAFRDHSMLVYGARCGLKLPNGRDVTQRAITDIISIVSGQNYDILTSIVAKLLTSGQKQI